MSLLHALRNRYAAALFCVALLAAACAPLSAQPAHRSSTLWPLSYTVDGGTVVVYEPQVRTLTNYTALAGAVAVAVTLPGAAAPTYGVLNFTSIVSANAASDTVTFVNATVGDTHWPTASATDRGPLDAFARANIRLQGHALPLATVLASIGKPTTPQPAVAVRTAPPTIFVSQSKALLIAFDGQPVWAPVKIKVQTDVVYAVNTNWPIFRDPARSHYYLLDGKYWLSAPAVSGPWVPDVAPAAWLAEVPNTPEFKDVRTKLSAPLMPAADAPKVFVSTTPADLLAFDGPPQFANIPGTQLRYVSNTTSDVFFSRDTTTWYVLLAGRWFSAANLNGPWMFASAHLPADFRKIPENDPRARVLVSVPGTNAAIFAGRAANVPHLTPLNASKARLDVSYAPGAPQFAPIAGTPLQRAVNTPFDVVKVNDTEYYACHNAVWFTAMSPTGPWKAATYVPEVIYTIPPSSPLYHDTYVYVYNAQGQVQHAPPATPAPRPDQTYQNLAASQISNGDIAARYTGYAAGYIGGYYGSYGAFSYGTGYYTPGYFNGGVWYPNPATFGTYQNTTFARSQELGPNGGANAMSAEFNPSTKSYARTSTSETVPADTTPRLHVSPTATRPDNDVYAGTDNALYRIQGNAWRMLGANGTWSPVPAAPAAVQSDYRFRVAGYDAQ